MWPGCTLKSPHGWPGALPDANGGTTHDDARSAKLPFSGLPFSGICGYSFSAAAKSAAGRENPSNYRRHMTRHASFLCRNQRHRAPDYGVVCGQSCRWHSVHPARVRSLCRRVNGSSGGAASGLAGIPMKPVFSPPSGLSPSSVRTPAIALFAIIGGCHHGYNPYPSHPEFVFVFAAVRRADRHPRICMLRTVAGDERSARRSLVRDYVLSLAARLPVVEVSRA